MGCAISVIWLIFFLKDGIKKMLERADQMNHNRISTSVIKSVFSASTDDQMRHAMKQLEGEEDEIINFIF